MQAVFLAVSLRPEESAPGSLGGSPAAPVGEHVVVSPAATPLAMPTTGCRDAQDPTWQDPLPPPPVSQPPLPRKHHPPLHPRCSRLESRSCLLLSLVRPSCHHHHHQPHFPPCLPILLPHLRDRSGYHVPLQLGSILFPRPSSFCDRHHHRRGFRHQHASLPKVSQKTFSRWRPAVDECGQGPTMMRLG